MMGVGYAIVSKEGVIALQKGYHHIQVTFFENAGGEDLNVYLEGPGMEKQLIPDDLLYYSE